MLEITIPGVELLNNKTSEFITTKDTTLQLEHSLLSLSKWESKYKKPFLGDGSKDQHLKPLEFIDYVRFMTLTKNVNPNVYYNITPELQRTINAYINDPMTATTISNSSAVGGSKQIMTAELIYWEMIELGIPFECQKWHLNRLLMLIRVCSIKQGKPEKMSRNEMLAQRRALNKSRQPKRRK